MSRQRQRIKTIEALIVGSIISSHASFNHITDELNEFYRIHRVVPPRRKRLLAILHLCRAYDSTLNAFLAQKGIPNRAKGIGGYLMILCRPHPNLKRTMTNSEKDRYIRLLVDERNKYLHIAGSYPLADYDVNRFLSELQSSLSIILTL